MISSPLLLEANHREGKSEAGKESFKTWLGDFSGGPVVETLCFQCRGCGFDPWSGN